MKRIIHTVGWFLLSLMFLAFAYLQWNDPDPLVWIFIYGAMAALCFLAIFRMYFAKVMIGLAILYIVYAGILIPGLMEWMGSTDRSLLFDDLAKMQFPYIEETREFLGLIICLMALGGLALAMRTKRYQ